MSQIQSNFIDGPNGRIAYRNNEGETPTIVWLGGFKSDMLGTKAEFLHQWAMENNRAFLRFDYTGHGESDGSFEDGTISKWALDAETIIAQKTRGPLILVGSSMGAWIATLVALKIPKRLAGVTFIAPAPDFTEQLMWPSLTENMREELRRHGKTSIPSDYGEDPTPITQALFDDGQKNLVMTSPIKIDVPICVLQGMNDPDVPFDHALIFSQLLTSDEITVCLTKSGDHRLSSPPDIARLQAAIESFSK